MTAALDILADGVEDLFEFFFFVVIAVIFAVVSIIKKLGARRAEEARRRILQQRSQQRPQQQPKQPARRAPQATGVQAGRQPQPHRPQPQPGVRPARPAGPPPAPPQIGPDMELAQQALRAMGLMPARPQPSKAEEPIMLTPAEPESVRVDEALRQERRRQRDAEAQRRKRLASPRVAEADSAAIESRILKVHPGQGDAQDLPTGPAVDLSSADRARRAIVFHEIFSAPKALRRGKEMWDV